MCCVVHFVQQQQHLQNEKYFPIKINEMAIFVLKIHLAVLVSTRITTNKFLKVQHEILFLYFLCSFNFALPVFFLFHPLNDD